MLPDSLQSCSCADTFLNSNSCQRIFPYLFLLYIIFIFITSYNIYIYHIFSGLESPRFYKRFSFHESSVFPFFYYFLFYHLYHILRSITRIFPKIIIFIRLSRNKWILWTAGSKEQALTKRRQICLYVTAGGGADET